MRKKWLIIAFLFLVVIIGINYLIIKPKTNVFWEKQLNEKFSGYIAYKNNQRGAYLYLVNDLAKLKQLKLDTLYENEAFHKPQLGDEIKQIILSDSILYNAAHFEDKVEKLPNSNKCYLFTKDAVFKFNCYMITNEDRKELCKINEWLPSEIGRCKQR